jgi:hypothetical protein
MMNSFWYASLCFSLAGLYELDEAQLQLVPATV